METNILVVLEQSKTQLFQAINKIQETYKLPSVLLEGVVVEALSQIRQQKTVELIETLNQQQQQFETKGKQEEKE